MQGDGLTAVQLRYQKGERILFNQLYCRLSPGELLMVRGANGSGKTSLLRLLAGLYWPDQGRIYWQGRLLNECHSDYCRELVYIEQPQGFKAALSVGENLSSIARLYPTQNTAEHALNKVGLSAFAEELFSHLSSGQQQRLALARLVLQKARLWILDEPLDSLDAAGVELLWQFVAEHVDTGGMVLMASHQACRRHDIPIKQLWLDYGTY